MKDELDDLLRAGQYRDYSEAIAVAISNQLTLHRTMAGTGSIVLGTDEGEREPRIGERVSGSAKDGGAKRTPAALTSIPRIFLSTGLQQPGVDFAPLPNDSCTIGETVPIDCWVFGQHNKLLPLKASVRALAVLLASGSNGVPLSQAAREIAREAERLGAFLRQVDDRHGFIRDEALATAFPSDSGDINKSRLRYANQFVASISKHGQLRGLPVDLKLINCSAAKESKLVLTEPGWCFAKLHNPILDGPRGSTERLSEAEREFLIRHIQTNVPVEDFAIRAVLGAVSGGASNPEELDQALAKCLPVRSEKPVSQAFLSTQRAGVISRMGDLGLIERLRDGLRVTYQISSRGTKYIAQRAGQRA